MVNYYSILKLPQDSTPEGLELAFAEFKKDLLKFSPGINLSDEELRLRKPEIWEAFDVLLNEEKRKQHDEVLERDRIHNLYEAQNKIEEEQNLRNTNRRKYIGLGTSIVIIVIYFLQQQISANSSPEKPVWQTHYITDEVKILLPAGVDSTGSILPANYATRSMSYVSKLSDGFSVTVGWLEMHKGYSLSFWDVGYIGSGKMHDMHRCFEKRDTVKLNSAIHNFNTQLIKGTYQIDNVIRAYENYTLIKPNEVIKVIVNYVPGNADHEKYCGIIFESLVQ